MSERSLSGAEQLVPRLPRTRKVALLLATLMTSSAVFTLTVPWQQSVSGEGRVLSWSPSERKQTIEAPVTGRVVRWMVRDGARVLAGDVLVELGDNDPRLLERMRAERAAVAAKLASYEARLSEYDSQLTSLRRARESELRVTEGKVRAQRERLEVQAQKLTASEAGLETAALQLERTEALTGRGLSALRDLELAQLAATKARTEREAARADARGAQGELEAVGAALARVRAETDVKLQETRAKLLSGESDASEARASLAKLDVALARQESQLVVAPHAGVVVEILATTAGQQVKQGDPLALLVPDAAERAVELWLDGNDITIVEEGRPVRLAFEGFPAVQFAGWPSVAVGTFAGVVRFIDPHADSEGRFRTIIVRTDTDERWPQSVFLRQGLRVRGWVLLEQVPIGFELWRQVNDFPPSLRRAPGDKNPKELP